MGAAIFSDQIGSLASWQYFGRRSVSSVCCFPNIGGKTQKTHWSQVFVSQILTQQQDARHHQKRKLYLKGDTNTNTNINKHKSKWWIDGYKSKYKTNTNTKVAAKWGIDRSHRQLWPSGPRITTVRTGSPLQLWQQIPPAHKKYNYNYKYRGK